MPLESISNFTISDLFPLNICQITENLINVTTVISLIVNGVFIIVLSCEKTIVLKPYSRVLLQNCGIGLYFNLMMYFTKTVNF